MGLLSRIDIPALAAFCSAYKHWREAEEALAKMAANDPQMNAAIIKNRCGEAAVNPLAALSRKFAGDMVHYAAEFGLTSAARARIGAAGYEPPKQSK
jgi:P27 family predicted phage terminase small subunit